MVRIREGTSKTGQMSDVHVSVRVFERERAVESERVEGRNKEELCLWSSLLATRRA